MEHLQGCYIIRMQNDVEYDKNATLKGSWCKRVTFA